MAEPPTKPVPISLQTRVHTLLYSMSVEAHHVMDDKGTISDEKWHELLDKTSDRILEEYEKEGCPKGFKAWGKQILKKISYQGIKEKIVELSKRGIQLGKTHGIPAAGGLVLGGVLEVAIPPLLIKMGHPELIPINVLIPYEPIFLGSVIFVANRMDKARLVKAFGGKEKYKKAMAGYQEARKILKLSGMEDQIFRLSLQSGPPEGVVVQSNSYWKRFKTSVGWEKSGLNLSSLYAYCRQIKVKDKKIDAIAYASDLDDMAKTVLILHVLEQKNDPVMMAKIKSKFKNSFVSLKISPHHDSIGDWIKEVTNTHSINELQAALEKTPENIPVQMVGRIWKEILLPELVTHVKDLSANNIKKLNNQFRPLLATIENSPGKFWDADWSRQFKEYFSTSTTQSAEECKRTLTRLNAFRMYY